MVDPLKLPTEFENWEFECATATFMHPLHLGQPGFYFQVQCVYSNTYEWQLYRQATYYRSRVYSHWDKRRMDLYLKESDWNFAMGRLLYVLREYPALLFNRTGEHPNEARNAGFVRLANQLLVGARTREMLELYC